MAIQLKKENKQVPSKKAMALIDTGASGTCISPSIVDELNLIPFDIQKVHTASGLTEQLLYDTGVILPISQPNIISVQTLCADLSGQPFQVLIGRDILSRCTLFYNGPDESFSLSF
ncbi:MAG: retroviral-like aspartic protease family protein [Ekhidna sp.]|nr:retroviral-like aspartic protease family protein [Ekhidna sp.]MBC6409664.1 retroviral-like aspartic protease family protein [Ekhidna sp.]MBC6426170.1 retroviral-like aspartic protease family protein [Ekhidna sp.]